MRHPSPHAGALLTLQRVTPYEARALALATEALDAQGRILERYSAYGDDDSPGVSWTAVLEAQSYALVVEDPDAPGERPFLHWMVWDIPGASSELPPGLSRVERPHELPGVAQGLNGAGKRGWHGPRPPPGHGVHHYHFQLFALARTLPHLPPDSTLERLVSALKALTIASGELVGTYEQRDPFRQARRAEPLRPTQHTGR